MANDVVIGASLQVDPGNTAPTIKEVRDSIKQYKVELENATVGSEQHRAALQKLETANKQLNPTFKEHSSTLAGINDHLSSALPAFGKASQGAQGFGATLKALMANPIVLLIAAIVAGLKFLYDAFNSTAEGANKIQQVFAGVSAVVESVANKVMHFGRAVLDFLTGHWSAAADEAKAAFTGIIADAEKAYGAAVEIKKRRQLLNKELKDEELKTLMQKEHLADLKAQLADEEIAAKDKISIAKKVKEEQKKLSDEVRGNAEKELNVSLAETAVKYGTTEEVARRTADLQIKLLQAVTEAEKNEIKQQIATESLKSSNQLEFIAAVKESIKNLHETTKQANDDEKAANKSERIAQKQFDAEDRAKEKEEADKRKEARQKARELEKERRENLKAYTEKLTTLQHENELNAIRDQTQKKLKETQFALEKENAAIEEDFKQKKISSAQRTTLLQQVQKAYLSKIDQINDEHQAEELKKQKEHEAALLKLQQDTAAKERELILKEEALKVAMAKKKFDVQRQELDIKQRLINDQYAKELQAAQNNALRIREIELKHNEDSFQITQARIAISKAEKDAKLADADAVGNALGAISQLIGQQTVVGKGLAVAQAIINTYTGATKALAQGGIAGIAGAAGVIATGLASVQKIIATQIPGQSSASASVSSASVSAPLQPKAQTTLLDQSSINAVGNAAVRSSRSYVLDSDIKNNRERIERINRAARIG